MTAVAPQLIPPALRRKRERLMAENTPPTPDGEAPAPAQAVDDKPDEAAFAVAPGSSTDDKLHQAVEVATTGNDDPRDHQIRTLKGMLKARSDEATALKAQNDTLIGHMKTLTERIDKIEKAAPAPRESERPAPAQAHHVEELTQDEREKFKVSLPVITKVARQVVRELIAPILARMDQFEAKAEEVDGEVKSARTASYRDRLYAAIPDLDEITSDEEFSEFIEGQASRFEPGVRIRDKLVAAHERQDVQAIKAVVEAFRKHSDATPSVGADPEMMRQPSGSSRSSVPPTPVRRAKLAWSKRVAAGEQLRRGKMTSTEFEKIRELYDKAAAEGRIDYGA